MFKEKSIFRTFGETYRKNKGSELAKDEIQRFNLGHPIISILAERERLFREHKGLERNSDFSGGWRSIWMDKGASDARNGICLSDQYENEWYNRGWCEAVSDMQSKGWNHVRLDAVYEDVMNKIGEFNAKERQE